MDIGYTWVNGQGTICRQLSSNMDHIYLSICASDVRGGDRVEGVDWGIVSLASCKVKFVRVLSREIKHKT